MPKVKPLADRWPGREDLYDEVSRRKRRKGLDNVSLSKVTGLSLSVLSARLNKEPGTWRLDEFDGLCRALGISLVDGIKILKGEETT